MFKSITTRPDLPRLVLALSVQSHLKYKYKQCITQLSKTNTITTIFILLLPQNI